MCVSVIIREIWLKVCKYSYSNFQYPIPIVFLIKSNENSQWDILYIYNYNLILSDWSKWLPAIYFNSATNSIVSFLKITYKQGVKKLWEGGGHNIQHGSKYAGLQMDGFRDTNSLCWRSPQSPDLFTSCFCKTARYRFTWEPVHWPRETKVGSHLWEEEAILERVEQNVETIANNISRGKN